MPDYNVIANVSETLVSVLTEALKELDRVDPATLPKAALHDLHSEPSQQGSEAGIVAVTLVELREDPTSRNRPRTKLARGADRFDSTKPAMALILRYLMTPWSFDDNVNTGGRKLEQKMLGRVTQSLYDNAIISGSDLKGRGEDDPINVGSHLGLEGSDQALKLKLAPLSFEEQTRFWHAVQAKYRPSLTYDIRVANLEPTLETSESLVVSREVQYGVLERS